MNFLKKHYEMLILGAVLVGMVAAVVFLWLQIETERKGMADMRTQMNAKTPKPLPPLDLGRAEAIIKQCQTPLELNFSLPNNLVNPVRWEKSQSGVLIPIRTGREVGPDRIEVTKVAPLLFSVSLDSYNASGSNYLIKVEDETERASSKRRVSRYVAVGGKTEHFTLLSVKGPPENPTDLELELADTGQKIHISTNKPFSRVEGYTADLRYDLENKKWTALRKDQRLVPGFDNDDFTVASINSVASNQYEIVLSAKSTGKKTTIKYNAAP